MLSDALAQQRAKIGITDGFVFGPDRAAGAGLFEAAAVVSGGGGAGVAGFSHVVHRQVFDGSCRGGAGR